MISDYDVFISYRRDGGAETALYLRHVLHERGYQVFFDLEALRNGPFDTRLYSVIEGCKDVIVVLSPGCFERCCNAGDWFRLEIAHALKCGKNIVPFSMRQFSFDEMTTLPEDIAALKQHNGVSASHEYSDATLQKLIDFLKSSLRENTQLPLERHNADYALKVLKPPQILIITEPTGAAVQIDSRYVGRSPLRIDIEKGEHRIRAELEDYKIWDYGVVFSGLEDAELRIVMNPMPTDPVEQFQYYQEKAEGGDIRAQYELASCYRSGRGIEKSEEIAFHWYRRASEGGCAPACVSLGSCYLWGQGTEKNDIAAAQYFHQGSSLGDTFGMAKLGDCFRDGVGVDKNLEEAVKWYRQSAQSGDEVGMLRLAECYYEGLGVSRDVALAEKYGRLAVEKGSFHALGTLAGWYMDGCYGFPKDYKEAKRLYQQMVGKDCMSSAGPRLGLIMELGGYGIRKNMTEAVTWYRLSAASGNPAAMSRLARLYEHGIGILKRMRNKKEAMKWYARLAEAGLSEGEKGLERLKKG